MPIVEVRDEDWESKGVPIALRRAVLTTREALNIAPREVGRLLQKHTAPLSKKAKADLIAHPTIIMGEGDCLSVLGLLGGIVNEDGFRICLKVDPNDHTLHSRVEDVIVVEWSKENKT